MRKDLGIFSENCEEPACMYIVCCDVVKLKLHMHMHMYCTCTCICVWKMVFSMYMYIKHAVEVYVGAYICTYMYMYTVVCVYRTCMLPVCVICLFVCFFLSLLYFLVLI